MREFSRQNNAEFMAFKAFAESAIAANPTLHRLDCLNPIKAIRHEFDFSYVPSIEIDVAWKQFLNVTFPSYMYSQGVRDSICEIFEMLWNRGISVDIPTDVYPVYQMIAQSVGASYSLYSAKGSWNPGSFQQDAALITAPLVPTGKDLSSEDVQVLLDWLGKSRDRILIIDRVYDYNNSDVIQPLIEMDQVFVCYSLSKTFLSPLMMGFTIVPSRFARSPDKPVVAEIDHAKVLLTRYKDFPRYQQQIFQYRWNRIQAEWNITPPATGYLTTVPMNHRELLKENVLAIPGRVFGAGDDVSIVSCLHETNSFAGTDEVERFHVTVLSNFAKGYDKYSRTYSKANLPLSKHPNDFYLLDEDLSVGFEKANRLLEKTVSGDDVIVLRTRVKNYELHANCRTGLGQFLKRNWIEIDGVLDRQLREIQVEDAYARSLALHELIPWEQVQPRSLSILPIARSCQAKCEFCFSHSSISEDQKQGKAILDRLDLFSAHSVRRGAERLVITGGGEPTLLPHEKLLELIRLGKHHFEKIVLITNGYTLGHASESERLRCLRDYEEAGLTVLAISRHSHDRNAEIMSVETKSELIAETCKTCGINFDLRWICVLQRRGVEDETTLKAYLDWAVSTGVTQICFKELYVAATQESQYYDTSYNDWCRKNQIPMKLVLNFLIHNQARKIAELPWGSPIYTLAWSGRTLMIAVYTEPSVFWERTAGICRSWNLMADGNCFASLETKDSEIRI
jgi:molybdenum cofactor biosynthesis enzyme MoaA